MSVKALPPGERATTFFDIDAWAGDAARKLARAIDAEILKTVYAGLPVLAVDLAAPEFLGGPENLYKVTYRYRLRSL